MPLLECTSPDALPVARCRPVVATVLASPWWFLWSVLLAAIMFLSDGYVGLRTPYNRSVPLLVVVPFAVLAEAAVQRWMHWAGYVDFGAGILSWSLEAMDVVAAVGFLVADYVQGRELYSSRTVAVGTTIENLREEYAVFGVTAFGILILTMLKTGVSQYRAMCWHAADPTKMHARTHTGNNMRIFLMIVVIFKTVGFAAMLQTVVQMKASLDRGSSMVAPANVVQLLAPITDETQLSVAAAELGSAIRSVSCMRIAAVQRGAWTVQVAGPAEETLLIVSNDGALTASFDVEGCRSEMAESFGGFKVAMLAIDIVWLLFSFSAARAFVVKPLLDLLKGIISLSSHLDGDGLLRDAVAAPNTKGAGADRGSDAKQVWAEEAVARTIKSIRLLMKASYRGQTIVKQVLREVGNRDEKEGMQMLSMFGAKEGEDVPSNHQRRAIKVRTKSRVAHALAKTMTKNKGSAGTTPISSEIDGANSQTVTPLDSTSAGLSSFVTASPDGWWAVDCLAMSRETSFDFVVEMFRYMKLIQEVPKAATKDPGEPSRPCRVSVAEQAMRSGSGEEGVARVREKTLRRFLAECEARYLQNPYHRWEHAVDVTFSTMQLLHRAERFVQQHLSPVDVLALMVASIAHDVGHRGLSNGFLVKTRDVLAMTYNDASPQEKLHASTLFVICSSTPEANVFELLSPEQFTHARKLIIDAILDTDMACHFSRLAALEVVVKDHATQTWEAVRVAQADAKTGPHGQSNLANGVGSRGVGGAVESFCPPEVRSILLGLLHAADLGNSFKPVHLHAKWAVQVSQEFFREGEELRKIGVSPIPLFDESKCYLPHSQMEFLDFIARPLFVALSRLVPELTPTVLALRQNFQFWAMMAVADKQALGYEDKPVPLTRQAGLLGRGMGMGMGRRRRGESNVAPLPEASGGSVIGWLRPQGRRESRKVGGGEDGVAVTELSMTHGSTGGGGGGNGPRTSRLAWGPAVGDGVGRREASVDAHGGGAGAGAGGRKSGNYGRGVAGPGGAVPGGRRRGSVDGRSLDLVRGMLGRAPRKVSGTMRPSGLGLGPSQRQLHVGWDHGRGGGVKGDGAVPESGSAELWRIGMELQGVESRAWAAIVLGRSLRGLPPFEAALACQLVDERKVSDFPHVVPSESVAPEIVALVDALMGVGVRDVPQKVLDESQLDRMDQFNKKAEAPPTA